MSGKEVELLAPAGKWDTLEKVLRAGADAVYLGGKRFNMRMLRPEYNFTEQELKNAVEYVHQRGKKLYVTLNNLYYDNEVEGLKDYMFFLQEIKVDALIVQDIGTVSLCKELGLNIPLHASVQMGILNPYSLKFLEEQGFERAILSRKVSLDEIREINKMTDIGLEYFAHGEMCISHTGQCYMSSFISGKSGNRGECIKPCRWQYSMDGKEFRYYLAHKDLCLYNHMLEMIAAGIISFKIEGRMRSADYLTHIIKIYRQAINEILKDCENYEVDKKSIQELYKKRERDFSTGSLFKRPGLEAIGITGEREPKFPTKPVKLSKLKLEDYQETDVRIDYIPRLSVKVGNLKIIDELCNLGIDNIILGLEGFRQHCTVWDTEKIGQALEIAQDSNVGILLETPSILNSQNIKTIKGIFNSPVLDRIRGIIVNDYGSYYLLKDRGQTLYGGPGLNISNSCAIQLLNKAGLKQITLSQESDFETLKPIMQSGKELEIIVHGPLCGMISDFCPTRALKGEETYDCSQHCLHEDLFLVDHFNQKFFIKTDNKCLNYIFYPHDLCLLPYLPLLAAAGLQRMRIDGQHYNKELVLQVVRIYKEAVDGLKEGKWKQSDNYNSLLKLFPQGLTAGPIFMNKN